MLSGTAHGQILAFSGVSRLATASRDIHGLPSAFRVKTGSWSTQLPNGHIRIGISRGTPRFGIGKDVRLYRKLNPGPWFNRVDNAEYLERYQAEVLDRLDPKQTLAEIEALARGRIPVLCCFEKVGTGQWCHRALVARWLAACLGIRMPEVAHEKLPQDQHPLLPPELRPKHG